MDRDQALIVKPGDMLEPLKLWNSTERTPSQLQNHVTVLAVREAKCETGVMFLVSLVGGAQRWLSAGWFCEPPAAR